MTLQIDLFWVYGIGATFAAAAARQLQESERPVWGTRYFAGTVTYLSLCFVPTAAYLLWAFPQWESMHVLTSRTTIHPILPALQAFGNVALGILGFLVSYRLVRAGRAKAAFYNGMLAYFGMFFVMLHGWDGYGWQRFLYDPSAMGGTWAVGKYAVVETFTGPVAITLYAMGVYVIPPMLYLLHRWISTGPQATDAVSRGDTVGSLPRNVSMMLAAVFGLALGGAAIATVLARALAQVSGSMAGGALVSLVLVLGAGWLLTGSDGRPLDRFYVALFAGRPS